MCFDLVNVPMVFHLSVLFLTDICFTKRNNFSISS